MYMQNIKGLTFNEMDSGTNTTRHMATTEEMVDI